MRIQWTDDFGRLRWIMDWDEDDDVSEILALLGCSSTPMCKQCGTTVGILSSRLCMPCRRAIVTVPLTVLEADECAETYEDAQRQALGLYRRKKSKKKSDYWAAVAAK